MEYSFRICRLFGIEVRIHFSLVFILVILTYIFYHSPPPYGFSNISGSLRLILSVVMALAIFISVLIHELSHSLVARRLGAEVKGIMLFIFGGVAMIEKMPKEPNKEFLIAVAGPLSSFALAMFGLLMPVFRQFFFLFGYFNLILAIFNLIPAFPMDGGRILRSFLARRLSYVKATKISADIGKILAVIMGITGLFTNIWLTLIALFIYIGAVEEEKAVTLEGLLAKYKVRDVMTPNPIYVTPDMSVGDVIDLMLKYKHVGYPVVENDRLVGIITLKDVINADKDASVADVMSTNPITVTPDTSVIKALKIMGERNIGRLPVVEDGKLVGIVSRSDIVKLAEILEILELRKH